MNKSSEESELKLNTDENVALIEPNGIGTETAGNNGYQNLAIVEDDREKHIINTAFVALWSPVRPSQFRANPCIRCVVSALSSAEMMS
jgi:hypothetical protein